VVYIEEEMHQADILATVRQPVSEWVLAFTDVGVAIEEVEHSFLVVDPNIKNLARRELFLFRQLSFFTRWPECVPEASLLTLFV
jgi:hypothetical protein